MLLALCGVMGATRIVAHNAQDGASLPLVATLPKHIAAAQPSSSKAGCCTLFLYHSTKSSPRSRSALPVAHISNAKLETCGHTVALWSKELGGLIVWSASQHADRSITLKPTCFCQVPMLTALCLTAKYVVTGGRFVCLFVCIGCHSHLCWWQ